MASHYTPVHPANYRHSSYGGPSPHDRHYHQVSAPHMTRPRVYPYSSAPHPSMAYYYRQSISSPSIPTAPHLGTAFGSVLPPVRRSSDTAPSPVSNLSTSSSSPANLSTILPRYRGKHLRAASTGSIPKQGGELSSETTLDKTNPTSSDIISEPIEKQHEGVSSIRRNHAVSMPPQYSSNCLPNHSSQYSQSHRRGHSSMSSSNASVDTDSTRTQTSMSSNGSVHSVEEEALKHKRAAKLTIKPVTVPIVEDSSAADSSAVNARVGAKVDPSTSLSANPNSPNTSVVMNTNPSSVSNSRDTPENLNPSDTAKNANIYKDSNSTDTVSSAKYPPKDSNLNEKGISKDANDKTLKTSLPVTSPVSLVLPSDTRRRSSVPMDAANSTIPDHRPYSTAGSYPVDTRPAYAPEYRRSVSGPSVQNRPLTDNRMSRVGRHEAHQSSARLKRAVSAGSLASKMSEDCLPERGNLPTVRKSRSFSAKLRDLFGSKSKPKADDDNQSIRSSKSSKSTLSVRSSSSFQSLRSAFGRKKDTAVELVAKKDVDSTNDTKYKTNAVDSKASNVGNVDPRETNSVKEAVINTNETHVYTTTDESMVSPEDSQTRKLGLDPGVPVEPTNAYNPVSNMEDLPRPPSPALRSAIRHEEPANTLIVEKTNSEHTPPMNLGAGDIFPGELKPENVETIVNSVQRTGSFKRQLSTTKPTKEETIPDAEEVEVEGVVHSPPILSSAMKQGKSRKKRSGATSNLLKVEFANQILVYKTYSAQGYDRTPDRMTCDQLSEPGMAQKLREELNHWKALMPIHPESVGNTQFFHT